MGKEQVASSVGRRWVWAPLITAVVAGGLGLASCSSQPSSNGQLSGGIRLLSGVPPPHTFLLDHQAGTAVVEREGQTVGQAVVATGHSFSFSLPEGNYVLTARVSGFQCLSDKVSVQAHRPATGEVTCSSIIPVG